MLYMLSFTRNIFLPIFKVLIGPLYVNITVVWRNFYLDAVALTGNLASEFPSFLLLSRGDIRTRERKKLLLFSCFRRIAHLSPHNQVNCFECEFLLGLSVWNTAGGNRQKELCTDLVRGATNNICFYCHFINIIYVILNGCNVMWVACSFLKKFFFAEKKSPIWKG